MYELIIYKINSFNKGRKVSLSTSVSTEFVISIHFLANLESSDNGFQVSPSWFKWVPSNFCILIHSYRYML